MGAEGLLTRHHLKTGIFVDGVSSYGRGSILITARLNSPKSRKGKGGITRCF
jgi:hypothetical protein